MILPTIQLLHPFTDLIFQFMKNFSDVWRIVTVYDGNSGYVEILTQVWTWGGNPPPAAVLGTRCHDWV